MLAAKPVLAGSLFLFVFGLSASALAVTRLVDSATGVDSGNCTVSACATIAYAVNQAIGGDTIDIADAVYTEMLAVDKSLIFQGESEQGTIIQADPNPFVAAGRVLTLTGDIDLTLADLTIRHGNSGSGAGLLINGSGALTLARATFYRNSAGGDGGGVNSATDGCTVAMDDVSFVENEAARGGGFAVTDCDLVTLEGINFAGNSGTNCGGAGRMLRVASAQLANVRFIGNSAGSSGGGALCVLNSLVEAEAVEFRGNFSNTAGGAIYSSNSTWTIANALFSGNQAENNGSAIHNVTSASITNLINVTIVGNRSNQVVGAINFAGAGMKIHNSIFWNNQNSNGIGSAQASIWSLNAGADVQNSLVQGFTAGELGGSGNFDGSVNPLFIATTSPLAAPTTSGDLHLREFSPVKDAGNNTLIAGFDFDLDGVARIFNGTVDLGPYEFGSGILFRDRFEQGGAP